MTFFSNLDIQQYLDEQGLDLPCPLIGIDDGYDQINMAFWVKRDGKLTIEEAKIKSRAKRGRHISNFQGSGVGLYSTGGETYTVSENLADHEDTRTDEYPKTALNRFLVHGGLNKIGLTGGQPVAIVTGLPIKTFMRTGGGVNEKLLDAKRANMMTPVTCGLEGKPSASVVFHGVFPEAIAGIADYLIDDEGNLREGRDPDVVRMALDIGGNTTDMAIILPGHEVGAIETIKHGVSHMRDRLRVILEDELELTLDSMSLDEALHTRKVSLFGEQKDVSEQWERAVSDVLTDIFHAAEAFRRKYPSLKEMVCFGGGAALCEDVIRTQFPSVAMVERPDGANARGYLKFATYDSIDEIREQAAVEAVS